MKNNILKTIRDTIIVGVILYAIYWLLDYIVGEIDVNLLVEIYEMSSILYAIFSLFITIIIYTISVFISQKICKKILKIKYDEAKKILLILLIIFIIIGVVQFILSYQESINMEKDLDTVYNTIQQSKSEQVYKQLNKKEKKEVDELYNKYNENKEDIMNLIKQNTTIDIVTLLDIVISNIVCLYIFGRFLFKRSDEMQL